MLRPETSLFCLRAHARMTFLPLCGVWKSSKGGIIAMGGLSFFLGVGGGGGEEGGKPTV